MPVSVKNVENQRIQTVEREICNMLEKFKRSIDRGIVSAGVQSTTYLETGKLRSKIDHTNKAIEQVKVEMGHAVYSNWKVGSDNAAYIEETCEKIRKLEHEIEMYRSKITELQTEKERVLSGNIGDDEWMCSCGQRNAPGARFCIGCGQEFKDICQKNTMICKKCGDELSSEAHFCPNCGSAQKAEEQ